MSKSILSIADGTNEGDAWGKVNQSFRDISLQTAQMASLKARLNNGLSGQVQVASDSTGDATNEWVYAFAEHLASEYPDHNVDYALRATAATGDYEPRTRISAGGLGDRKYTLTGAANYGFTQPSPDYTTSDIDVTVRASFNTILDGTERTLKSHYSNSAGTKRFLFRMNTFNNLELLVSEDGTAVTTAVSWGTPENDLSDGVAYWFRSTFDASNSTGTIYYKINEGDAWIQMAQTVGGGSVTLFEPTIDITCGVNGGGGGSISGDLYECRLQDGIGGVDMVPRDLDKWAIAPSAFFDNASVSGSPTITIWNMAESGISTFSIAGSIEDFSQVGCDLYVLSSSYNDSGEINSNFEGSLDLITGYWLGENIILTAQPSMILGTLVADQWKIDLHTGRVQTVIGYANKNGYGYMDVFREFTNDGRALSILVSSDGVHPTTEGMTVWSTLVTDSFDRSY